MKYIDAEKLMDEIEFALAVYSNPHRVVHGIADAFRQDGRAAMCKEILKKIDSLQQEQPSLPSNLDEAAEEYADYNSQRWHEDGDVYYDHSKIMDAFKAGAEWMAGQGETLISEKKNNRRYKLTE